MEEKRRERETPDHVNEKEMDVMEESDDINDETEMNAMKEKRREILEAPLPPTPIKCENNDSASSSSDQHEQHQPKDSIIVIEELEELMEFLGDHVDYNLKDIHVPEPYCCIYRVPKDVRKINEVAYTPQVISISSFHHGRKEFIEMEKQKLRYMLEFNKRVGAEKLKEMKRYIEDYEQDIRNFYQENSSLPSPKFVNMILHDAVFIIEVFLECWLLDRKFDFFLHTPTVRHVIKRDLQLLENQLPYMVLQKLIELGGIHNVTNEEYPDHDPLLILSHKFFQISNPIVSPKPMDYLIQHFTDLRRYFLLMNFCPEREPGKMRDLPVATKLHGSGVKFKMGIEDSLEISCKHVKNAIRIPYLKSFELPIPWIKELELQIPRFEIYDSTESLYRNMMAWEQFHYPGETHICAFILLMDHLIDTVKDVDLLVDEGIIVNNLGDNAAIAKMFNNLGFQIVADPSKSYNISKKLKDHYDNRWNHTMATFRTVYFSDIWTGTATVAAVILLVLTFIQTVFSIVK